jgi:hypothetical protein
MLWKASPPFYPMASASLVSAPERPSVFGRHLDDAVLWTGGDRRGTADDCDQIALAARLDAQDAKAVRRYGASRARRAQPRLRCCCRPSFSRLIRHFWRRRASISRQFRPAEALCATSSCSTAASPRTCLFAPIGRGLYTSCAETRVVGRDASCRVILPRGPTDGRCPLGRLQ